MNTALFTTSRLRTAGKIAAIAVIILFAVGFVRKHNMRQNTAAAD